MLDLEAMWEQYIRMNIPKSRMGYLVPSELATDNILSLMDPLQTTKAQENEGKLLITKISRLKTGWKKHYVLFWVRGARI